MREWEGQRRLVIVGGGVSGVAAFIEAVRRDAATSIDIVDAAGVGHGVAFAATDEALLCNTSVETMSILDDNRDDFLDYLRSAGVPASRMAFVSRCHVARYLASRYTQYRNQASAAGVKHRLIRAMARTVTRGDCEDYRIELDDGTTLQATDVFICTGHGAVHVPEALRPHVGAPQMFASLYPERAVLDRLTQPSQVLVLGSRLSAVDATLLLCSAGHEVVMASPSARLPAVRTATPRTCPVDVNATALDSLDLSSPDLSRRLLRRLARSARAVDGRALSSQTDRSRDVSDRLRREVLLARQGVTDWQALITRYMDVAEHRLSHAEPELQRQAIAKCWHAVGRYLFACPLQTAEKLLAFTNTGRLRIRSGTPTSVEPGPCWRVLWGDGSQDLYDAVVCATGFDKQKLMVTVNGLALRTNGPAPGKSPHIDANLRIWLDGAQQPERIWVLGLASQTAAPMVNSVYQSVRQAHAVCASWRAEYSVESKRLPWSLEARLV